MLKQLFFGCIIAILPSLPAIAVDWRTTGVSRQTGETVAIDVNSISRISRYDVRFRYLIGKDLVQASVNCDSSLVTPSKGKPFVPDSSGATREMIKLACDSQETSTSDSSYFFGRGVYQRASGHGGIKARGFFVSDAAIAQTRNLLRQISPDHPFINHDATKIADDIARYCGIRAIQTDDEIVELIDKVIADSHPQVRRRMIAYTGATMAAAKKYTCPQYDK